MKEILLARLDKSATSEVMGSLMLKNRKLLRRRNFLLGLGSCTFLLAGANRFKYYKKVQVSYNANRKFSVVSQASLRTRSQAKGLIYGAFCEGSYKILSQDKQLQSAFVQECGLLVGGFYWLDSQPSMNTFDFAATDSFAQFASRHTMLFRGHPLIWHQLLPDWLTDKFKKSKITSQEIQDIFINHITTIVRRYAGRIHSWDVVNEAIEPNDKRTDGLRKTPWLNFLGSDYIEMAFKTAARSDPKALLVYNDYGLEYDLPDHEAKRIAVLKLLEHLKSRGTPIHALGMQSHLPSHETKFNPQKLRTFLQDVASLGLKIMITELDVSDKELAVDIDVRDRIVAGVYEDYLSVVLDEPAVIAVTTWGLSDRYTWLQKESPRSDRAAVRPLPLDANFQRKLAWNAMARAFDKARKR